MITNKRKAGLIVCLIALSFCVAAAFGLMSKTVETVRADEVKAYTVFIPGQDYGNGRSIVNRFLPNPEATTVTMEYKVISSNGWTNTFGATAGGDNLFFVNGFTEGGFKGTWIGDGTYKFVFDPDEQSAAVSVYKNGVLQEENIRSGSLSVSTDLRKAHMGIYYGSSTTTSDPICNWEATLEMRCYDDTGKDLQIVSGGGNLFTEESLVSEPSKPAALSTFCEADTLLTNGSADSSADDIGLDERYVYFDESEELSSAGADGSVLVIKKPANHGTLTIMFGRALTKAEIDMGGELVFKVKSRHNGWLEYCEAYASDADTATKINTEKLMRGIYNSNTGRFEEVVLSGEDLKTLADKNGDVNGIQFRMGGWAAADYTVWLDEVFYRLPVTVNFYDKDNVKLSTENIYSGYEFKEQIQTVAPNVEGKIFLGWATDENRSEYFGKYVGYSEKEINLYASYSDVKDNSVYVGVYANALNGKYFELKSDGTVADETGAIGRSQYVIGDGVILFDGVAVYELSGNTVVTDGETKIDYGDSELPIIPFPGGGSLKNGYTKQSVVHTVEYKIFGNLYKTVMVPDGYYMPEIDLNGNDYIHDGWLCDGVEYSGKVVDDVVLTADIKANEISSDEYAEYENAYYNEDTGIFYIVKAPEDGTRTLVKVENGKSSAVGKYRITKGGNLYSDGVLYPFNPFSVTGSSGKEVYVGPLSLTVDGVVYWKAFESFTVTIHYNDAENNVENITVGKDNDYLVTEPQARERTGYKFIGWKLGDGSVFNFDTAVISGETEVYAVWEKIGSSDGKTSEGCKSSTGIVASMAGLVVCLVAAAIIGRKKRV